MEISNEKDVYYRCYLLPFCFYYNTLYLKLDVEYDINIFMAIELRSEITCPECSFKKTEQMQTNACQFFYECSNCKKILKPNTGDCCVYCSYGSVSCPPIQENKNCC
jgi:hypothetical protein